VRTFASLVGRDVVTESGLSLGRLHDLRGELEGSRLEIAALCVGPAGGLSRLGIRSKSSDVDWSAVVRIEGDRIVVRDP
jgi:sporulation protein YlmC with PRC-barrel domain